MTNFLSNVIIVVVCGLLLGAAAGWFFDCGLEVWFGIDVPWYCDVPASMVTAPLLVPATIIGTVLALKYQTPLVPDFKELEE